MHPLITRAGPPAAAAGVGGLLGYGCATVVFVGSGVSLVPWGVAGMAVGLLSGTRRRAVVRGAAFGFVLAYVFMVAGYDGAASLHTRLVPFLVFGAVGAGAGVVLAVAGLALRDVFERRRRPANRG